jgi:hypothetical protein
MAGQWWTDDDQLLDVLQDALTITREMSPDFIDVGKAAYVWRTIDAELAALTYDSVWDGGELALTRADSAMLRTLTFGSDALTIELELTSDEVLGQISPPEGGTVSLRTDTEELGRATVDDLGFFIVRPVPGRPFRVLCQTDSGVTVLTGWVSP